MKLNALFVVTLVALTASVRTLRADDITDPFDAPLPDVKGYVSERTMAIMSGATRVEVFRIKAPPRRRAGQPPTTVPAENIGGYPIVSHPKERDKDFAARFVKVAFDGKSYALAPVMCFTPGVALRFWKERQSVDVLICFHCGNILMTTTGTNDGRLITFHPDRGKPAFIKLAKEAFPDDDEIQKLGPPATEK